MANFLIFTVLFFIIPLSYARMQPGNAFIGADLPDSEVNPSISVPALLSATEILPEKETGINELAEKLSENESHINEIAELLDMMLPERITDNNELDEKLTESNTVKSVQLRMAKIRPVNQHFRLKWGLSWRPCHHHHHHHHHLTPYSSDMLIPTGEKGDFDRVSIHRIPSRWISLPYHHDHNDDDDESKSVFTRSAGFGKEKLKKHDENEEEIPKLFKWEVKTDEHNKENGLLQRIRKMLIF